MHKLTAIAIKGLPPGKCEDVLQHAAALELDVDLQAVLKAKAPLGAQRHTVTAVPSMPWQDVPGFYATLQDPSPVNLALRLLILTGLRSLPVRFARIDEVEGDIWTVPAKKMKGRRGKVEAFRVPLTSKVLRVIELAKVYERKGLSPSCPQDLDQRRNDVSDDGASRTRGAAAWLPLQPADLARRGDRSAA
ncbi:MAG: hypothetical protein AAGE03_02285 [Pseudomonadota bacterium]